jgi:hypothetical protein
MNNGFTQCITKATRINNKSFSLIDHILTNSGQGDVVSGTVNSDISDHFVTFVLLSAEIGKNKDELKEPEIFVMKIYKNLN